ncbi:MAP3K12-binding inhibitory protein 1-like [Xenia sp. Carnegie-2017]|uniref:MAP3K12-binding inhibitory protein 1-like n=1 Tax=Xenia sp. Carnegie-2017 TaxID=2897299 RepID=UPI001F03E5D2|nr:MAP3K12-binding inhibitory protein 1-like [Xenia sp. Carnegie-2017]XP_046849543.1 MAP3K12-binding inhibitory protein 1-like [Xenia sp. Carnegie-2017]XP_046849544.1 MAP3K12-binding inhibitory protein 1-like [Xenia sp. Carnegie-2017]
MADVLQAIEMHLLKMAGECVDLKVDYERFQWTIEHTTGEATFWQIVQELVELLQTKLMEQSKLSQCLDGKSILRQSPSSSFVQITANKAEIDRRIAAFVSKKQLDVDLHNQREFCNLLKTENEFSCARVDAVFLPRVGQNSHITVTNADHEDKIMKSDNVTVDTMLYSIPVKRQKTSEDVEELPSGVEERLHNIESHLHLNVNAVPKPVFSRIKSLEKKILYLESLSPEYFSFQSANEEMLSKRYVTGETRPNANIYFDNNFNDLDIDERMSKLKDKLLSEKSPKTK